MRLILWILVFSVISLRAQVSFTQGPTASLQDGKINISFAVSVSTDVEVAILDGQSKIVRHLAAGVLGGQYAPPTPLTQGLTQSLIWDGLDDYDKAVPGGPFKARVRLGVHPVFERSMSTKVYPSNINVTYYSGSGLNPTEDYILPSHPVLQHIETHNPGWLRPNLDFTVSDATDEIFIYAFRNVASSITLASINGETGQYLGLTNLPISASNVWPNWGEPRLDWNGQYLFHDESNNGTIFRFDISGSPAPWPGTGKNVFNPPKDFQAYMHTRGHAPGPDGSHYLLHHRDGRGSWFAVSRIKDGIMADHEFIVIEASVSGGLKVDLQGNIYVGARVKPVGHQVPPHIDQSKLSGSLSNYDGGAWTQLWWADEMYGSLIKYPPTGGSVLISSQNSNVLAGSGSNNYGAERTLAVAQGHEWMLYKFSHITTHSSWRAKCWCHVTRFDVDRFGRIFFPNTFEHQVIAVDNNRNEIFSFRNRDFPEVAIGMGHAIEATDRAIYVADGYNNQVVSFRLDAEKEAVVGLPLSMESNNALLSSAVGIVADPNPFKATITLRVQCKTQNVKCKMQIYDIHGRMVYQFKTTVKNRYTWNAGHLPGGVYIVRMVLANGTFSKKIFLTK